MIRVRSWSTAPGRPAPGSPAPPRGICWINIPPFSVRRWSSLLPYRQPQDLEFILEPLRMLGLPE